MTGDTLWTQGSTSEVTNYVTSLCDLTQSSPRINEHWAANFGPVKNQQDRKPHETKVKPE